jgi:AraC-like DNA-binding protein/mannose-6-phosphate isomerase-like protein (cupin superfamily)
MQTHEPVWEHAFAIIEPQVNAAGIHVWPFDPTFPIDVRHLVSDGPHQVRMNRHRYLELIYVYSGQTQFRVQNRSFSVQQGDLIVVGENVYHVLEYARDVRIVTLFFEPEIIRAADASCEEVEYIVPFLQQDGDFPHLIGPETGIPAQVMQLLERIRSELGDPSSRARLSVKTYLKMILILLVNHYAEFISTKEAISRRHRDLERLRPLFDHLEKNYREHIRVQDAARLCGMSSSHLMSFFRQVTGQSFLAYVNHFRIAKSQVLLRHTDKTVSEVSQEVGFCDQSHFGLVFRKLVGITPLAYRQRFGREKVNTRPDRRPRLVSDALRMESLGQPNPPWERPNRARTAPAGWPDVTPTIVWQHVGGCGPDTT